MKRLFQRLFIHKAFVPMLGLLAADAVLFGATDPQAVPSWLLIVGFLLLSLTFYCVLRGGLALLGLAGLPIRRPRRLLRAGTALFGVCAALQSVGQLSSRDVLVLFLLAGLLYLYTAYAKGPRSAPGS